MRSEAEEAPCEEKQRRRKSEPFPATKRNCIVQTRSAEQRNCIEVLWQGIELTAKNSTAKEAHGREQSCGGKAVQ